MRCSSFPRIALLAALCPVLTASLQAAPVYTQGNGFSYTGANSAVASPTAGQYARFTAPETTTATSLSLNLNANTATSMTFGLQADDGTGKPTGTFIASDTIAVTPTGGWHTINFTGVTLTEGVTYHVVLNPTTSGNALWRLLQGTTAPLTQPFGIVDPMFGRSNISNLGPQPIGTSNAVVYHIGTTGTLGVGQPYTGGSMSNFNSAGALAAQRFIHHTSPSGTALESITLRLTTGTTAPASDVTVTLLDEFDMVLEQVVLSKSDLLLATAPPAGATRSENYTINFSGLTELEDGKAYSLALSTIGSAGNAVRWNYMNTDNAAYQSATFQGTQGYAFTYTAADFSTKGTSLLNNDYIFTYTMTTAVPEPGAFALGGVGAGFLWLAARRRKNVIS